LTGSITFRQDGLFREERRAMPGKYRQQRSIRTREDLLDVVAEEFLRLGYSGANLQRVVERLNLTKGALYGHFTSKSEVAATLLRQFWAELDDLLGQGSGEGGAQERITRLFDWTEDSVRAAAALRLLVEQSETRAASLPELGAVRCRVAEQVASAQEAGHLGRQLSAGETADLVMAVLVGSRQAQVVFGSDDAPAQIRRLWSLMPPERG
jgi:AcrR family transcriptional regulator